MSPLWLAGHTYHRLYVGLFLQDFACLKPSVTSQPMSRIKGVRGDAAAGGLSGTRDDRCPRERGERAGRGDGRRWGN